MIKFNWVFSLCLSVFLAFSQKASVQSEPSAPIPSALHQQITGLKARLLEAGAEGVFPEMEKLEQELRLGELAAQEEDLLNFYSLYLEVLKDTDQAQKGIDLALDIQKSTKLESLESGSWAQFFANLGLLYDQVGQTAKAVQAYEKAVERFESQAKPDYQKLAATLNSLGFAYYNLSFQNKTIVNYHKAFAILKVHGQSDYLNMTDVVKNLAYIEYEYGNNQGIKDLVSYFDGYIQQAKATDTLETADIQYMQLNQYLNKSRLYEVLRDSVGMEKLIPEVDKFMKEVEPDFRAAHQDYQLSIYESAGALFKFFEQYDVAERYYQKMQEIPLNDFYQMKYAANLAMMHYYDSAYAKSLDYAEESLRKLEEMGYRGSSTYTVMVLKAELLNRLEREAEAKDLIVQIYSELLERELQEADLEKLSYSDFQGMNTDRHITIIFRSGNIYRHAFRNGGDRSDFDRAYNFYQIAAEMFHEFYLKGSYNAWLETLNKEIEGGILSLLAEGDLVSEDSIISSLDLMELNASQEIWKKFVSKNEESLGQTAEMISEFNLKQLELEAIADSLKEEKQELQLTLSKLEEDIASERTVGFYSGRDFDLAEFQKSIPEDEQVLKFYVADLEVFGVLINTNEVTVRNLGKVKDLEQQVDRLRASILEVNQAYTAYSQELYEAILSPFPIREGKRLQIIPDDFLHLLPFEVLSTSSTGFLIEKTPIAYQHSFQLLNYRNPVQSKFTSDFLIGFAPSYEGTQFSAIENNLEETQRIVSYHSGEAKVGQEASKRNFVESLADYRIYHLAMHTEQEESNYDQSALVFANEERLRLNELYRMNFPSELVVLSACNTGVGQLQPGEGLSSLARALTFAGVRSSIYSLWEVPDKETSDLMIFFYEEIKNGLPKDQALAAAKRRFLAEYPLKNHPIFWAGFVINGQLDPVKPGGIPTSWILGILAGLLLAGGGFLAWKKSRN